MKDQDAQVRRAAAQALGQALATPTEDEVEYLARFWRDQLASSSSTCSGDLTNQVRDSAYRELQRLAELLERMK